MHRPSFRQMFALGLLVVVVVLFVGMLSSIALMLYAVGAACWQQPIAIVPIGLVLLWLVHSIRRIHRTERAEMERFRERPKVEELQFLEEIRVDPSSPEAKIALDARGVFARLGCVPPESLRASDRFYPDLGKLPFYDSIDSLMIIFELEKQLKIKIFDGGVDWILHGITPKDSSTVGDAVVAVLEVWRNREQPQT